jgi:GNAT superfamily N-acetyltransferase
VGAPGWGGVRAAADEQVDVVGHDLQRLGGPALLDTLGREEFPQPVSDPSGEDRPSVLRVSHEVVSEAMHRPGGAPVRTQRSHARMLHAAPGSSSASPLHPIPLPDESGSPHGRELMGTRAQDRRRGVATAVLRCAAGWAADHGAHHLYLQVEERNLAAVQLDTRLGFQRSHHYHDRAAEP